MNAPDPDLVRRIAADLAVDPAFVEKDWAAVRVIAAISEIDAEGLRPVFSGGTSLSKAYDLIQRFSEDVDFKAVMPVDFPSGNAARKVRSNYRRAVIGGLERRGWGIVEDSLKVGNDSQFFSIHLQYDRSFGLPSSLRPHIQIEMTLRPPSLPPEERPVQSFVSLAGGQVPEVPAIACVSPAETAADKLSALTWRILENADAPDRRDHTLVRHLHDLAALSDIAVGHDRFRDLALNLLDSDAGRIRNKSSGLDVSGKERLARVSEILAHSGDYRKDYESFVMALSYARDDERPGYDEGVEALRNLANLIFV